MRSVPQKLKLLLVLVFIQIRNIQLCLSLDITRGDHDKFRSDILGIMSGASCKPPGYCTCDGTDSRNTFVLHSKIPPSGYCVKDQDIIRSQSGQSTLTNIQCTIWS